MPESFPIDVPRFLQTLGVLPSPARLAHYFASRFLEKPPTQADGVQAQTFSIVEGMKLNPNLLELLRVNQVQNLLNHAASGDLNVLVVQQNSPPHDQQWSMAFSSNFHLIQSTPQVLDWKLLFDYKAQTATLENFQIKFDTTEFERFAPTIHAFLRFHGCLSTDRGQP
jgi:hypothetical protein